MQVSRMVLVNVYQAGLEMGVHAQLHLATQPAELVSVPNQMNVSLAITDFSLTVKTYVKIVVVAVCLVPITGVSFVVNVKLDSTGIWVLHSVYYVLLDALSVLTGNIVQLAQRDS